MTRALLLLLCLPILPTNDPAAAQERPAGELLTNARLVSPERARIVPDAWILIRGERIESVGSGPPTADLDLDGVTRRNVAGKYVIPGLIDAHVHLTAVAGMNLPLQEEHAELTALYREQQPRSWLYYGYTTLIDLNLIDREPLDRLRAAPIAPDVYDCDNAAGIANGYPMSYLPADERFDACRNFLYDPRQSDAIPARHRPEDHTPKAVARRVKEAGGIAVKTHWEDGFGPGQSLPTPTIEMIEELVEAAHGLGMPVLMHANSFDAHSFAAASGVDVIVHGMWNWDRFDGRTELAEAMIELLDVIVADEIGYMPTQRVIGGLASMFDDGFLADPHVTAVLPPEVIAWIASEEGQFFKRELRAGDFRGLNDAQIVQRMAGGQRQGAMALAYLAEAGANLLFGSDTPSSPTYGNPPGANAFFEMQALVEAGVSLPQLLRMATIANARAFGLEEDYGTIEEGKLAHLVLLRENPLAHVEAYDTIETIYLRGRRIERETLRADSR